MSYSLGIGLTNECNLTCAHCYRSTSGIDRLSMEDVRRTCDSLPVSAANLGTGENGLHPSFNDIAAYLLGRGIRTSLTTNGYTVGVMPDTLLRLLAEVEFSFDFPTQAEQDAFRGAGSWELAMQALKRCRTLGLPVTIIAVMMQTNYRRLPDVVRLAQACGANFRVNVYQPVRSDAFSLSYAEFWQAWRLLLESAGVVTTTEPILSAMLGLNSLSGCACGRRIIRVTPQKRVIPCVYWPGNGIAIDEFWERGAAVFETGDFCATRLVPAACRGCAFEHTCAGGCAGRRMLAGDLAAPDPFCPVVRGETPRLAARVIQGARLLKSGSACTTVLKADGDQGSAA